MSCGSLEAVLRSVHQQYSPPPVNGRPAPKPDSAAASIRASWCRTVRGEIFRDHRWLGCVLRGLVSSDASREDGFVLFARKEARWLKSQPRLRRAGFGEHDGGTEASAVRPDRHGGRVDGRLGHLLSAAHLRQCDRALRRHHRVVHRRGRHVHAGAGVPGARGAQARSRCRRLRLRQGRLRRLSRLPRRPSATGSAAASATSRTGC